MLWDALTRTLRCVQAREGCATYLTGPWNVLDVVASSLLLIASAFYFVGLVDGVRTAGALGVALKCFGMVDYLRSWPATGSLVRMISVRTLSAAAAPVSKLAATLQYADATALSTGDHDGHGAVLDDPVGRDARLHAVLHDPPVSQCRLRIWQWSRPVSNACDCFSHDAWDWRGY